MKKTKNLISHSLPKAPKARKSKRALMKAMTREKKTSQQVENASINCALPKKYTKRSGLGFNKTNTASFAKIVMRTTITISIASFASRSIRIIVKMKMMTNG